MDLLTDERRESIGPVKLIDDPSLRRWTQPVVEAQSIVRILATRDPIASTSWCALCFGTNEHEPSCTYRRAVEWVEANPA